MDKFNGYEVSVTGANTEQSSVSLGAKLPIVTFEKLEDAAKVALFIEGLWLYEGFVCTAASTYLKGTEWRDVVVMFWTEQHRARLKPADLRRMGFCLGPGRGR